MSAATKRSVGIIGLGAMGLGVARSLLRAGFAVHACDMRAEVLATIASEGGQPHQTPASLAAQVDALIVL
ncbi:MAG: NAD(P)-binding domain-containing protein, partial [Quisquiliibacterium sp.]